MFFFCITADDTADCAKLIEYFDRQDGWSLMDCNIVCCKGDLCNNATVPLKPTERSPTDAGDLGHYSPAGAVLAFATIIAAFCFF